MTGLYHTLNVGAEALFTTRQGVDTAGHNIANAQTEGFSRQRVNVTSRHPSEVRGVLIGNGVFVKNITRAHDRFLEKHLNQINQKSGQSEAFHSELKNIEDIFSPEINASVADELSNFFNSMREMSKYPEDLTARTAVRETANSLTNAFLRVDDSLRGLQRDVNDKIFAQIDEANTLIEGIKKLNISIQNLEAGQDRKANDLRDKQDSLLRSLSEIMDIQYYRGDMDMVVVRGPSETLLVDRGNGSRLEGALKPGTPNFWNISIMDDQNRTIADISPSVTSGKLRAYFDVRDDVIHRLISSNNELAHSLAKEVNEVHKRGFGLNDFKEVTGRDFFTLEPEKQFAARSIRVSDQITQSTDAISAGASPNSPGDNVIINDIVRLENNRILGDGNATFNDFYANTVGSFGLEVVRAQNINEADQLLKNDLVARRQSIAGVSMDEEATNLLKWQANFTASSKVITTVDEMLETVLGLKR